VESAGALHFCLGYRLFMMLQVGSCRALVESFSPIAIMLIDMQ